MCTFTLAWQTFEDAPVVVAANRDEQFDRPTVPPARRDWEAAVVAPADEEAGGTWLGYNEHGVLVALTNRWVEENLSSERSRGLLVRDALGYETAEDAARHVEHELDEQSYDGFNLVVADAGAAILVEWWGGRRVRNLDPGVHIVVNVGANGEYVIPSHREDAGQRQARNADGVRARLQPEPGESSHEWLDRASAVISDHEYGVCIHGDGFGTRSSSLIRMDDEVTWQFADGPPCENDYKNVESRL